MKCHVCGSGLKATIADLPFRVRENAIVIVKGLPVLQCESCGEFLIEHPIMERLEAILDQTDQGAELEIIRFAA
jgi:YgiT-type zinc finger domain-containing protein